MSSISLPQTVLTRACELFVLYSKKGAFQIEEYVDAGSVYKRFLEAAKESGEVSEIDIKYVISAINVCSQRTPVEAQNYKPIADLLEALAQSIRPAEEPVADEEEEKPATITEL